MNTTFGRFIKQLRINRGMTMRDHCLANGFDPGNYSRLERGVCPPPNSRHLLEQYATALGLVAGLRTWDEFFDIAAACSGTVPEDLMSDGKIAAKLPVIFRVLRDGHLDEMIALVRESESCRQ